MSKVKFIKKDNLSDIEDDYKYYIEYIEKDGLDIVVKGWVFSLDNCPIDVELVDNKKKKIEKSKVWRKTRKDVKEKYGLDNDYKSEFIIRFDRSSICEPCIYIHFIVKDGSDVFVEMNMSGVDFSFTKMGKIAGFVCDKPIKRILGFVKNNDSESLYGKVSSKFKREEDPYAIWRERHIVSKEELEKQTKEEFAYSPLISISIPLYNTPMEFFEPLIISIVNQTYSNFQLCLADGSDNDRIEQYVKKKYADDIRINYVRLEENFGIAGNTNRALEMAKGDYVMLVDHDDVLELSALYEIVKVLNEDDSIDIIYTDEDLIDATGYKYIEYRFKPDFNYEMLRHLNYICHIFFVRKSIMDKVGGFREEYDGAQDFDMILRCCEMSDKIYHIPKVLYHWRAHEDSTAGNIDSKQYAIDASVKALQAHYERVGIEAEVEATDIFIMLRTTRKLKNEPLVSILIPSMDHIDDLDKCIRSIVNKTKYSNYEIIVIENNSVEDETFQYYDRIISEYDFVKVCKWKDEFNYSKINNFGAKYASGEYYILLNNDIEVISPDWINRMVAYCQDEAIGAVGVKLLYPDDTVQHCGIVIGVGGFAGHILTNADVEDIGYFGRLRVQQEVSAVTAACMMVDAKVFEEVGGFDEDFTVALNDVDLCLKIRDFGKKIILDPNIMMYHYESKSRGYEDSPEKISRFKKEIKRFREKWESVLCNGDPYYSPNLTLDRGDCSPRREDERFLIIEEIERGEM